MIIELIDEAVAAGARQSRACEVVGIDARTLQRWREQDIGDDRRNGPRSPPSNRLSAAERQRIVEVVTSRKFRELSPWQIVPRLADAGEYLASEATMYRILREQGLQRHRRAERPASGSRPKPLCAGSPNSVWCWDITYLPSARRGCFFYLYLIEDLYSRAIVGWEVHEAESMELAANLVEHCCEREKVSKDELAVHADNGGPMKGSTMLATMRRLGVMSSFSRPGTPDDNPFAEALFKTMKYRPWYPKRPFESLEKARAWVASFVDWYNHEHLHSAIGFVTPSERHQGLDEDVRNRRRQVYERAQSRHPERWSCAPRAWQAPDLVVLNPARDRARPARCSEPSPKVPSAHRPRKCNAAARNPRQGRRRRSRSESERSGEPLRG
jgi:putative transposase